MNEVLEKRVAMLEARVAALEGMACSPVSINVTAGAAADRGFEPEYNGDGYDRAGCRVVVVVGRDSYGMTAFAPNGLLLESYSASTPAEISRKLREWCEGKVPRPRAKSDQASSPGV